MSLIVAVFLCILLVAAAVSRMSVLIQGCDGQVVWYLRRAMLHLPDVVLCVTCVGQCYIFPM